MKLKFDNTKMMAFDKKVIMFTIDGVNSRQIIRKLMKEKLSQTV